MRLLIAAVSCLMIAASQPALAAWAVAQSNNDQPYSQRFRLESVAREVTMDACSQHHPNCRIVVSGGSGCVAIATTGSQWGVAKAGSRSRAHDAALGVCEGLNAGACQIEYEFCGQ